MLAEAGWGPARPPTRDRYGIRNDSVEARAAPAASSHAVQYMLASSSHKLVARAGGRRRSAGRALEVGSRSGRVVPLVRNPSGIRAAHRYGDYNVLGGGARLDSGPSVAAWVIIGQSAD